MAALDLWWQWGIVGRRASRLVTGRNVADMAKAGAGRAGPANLGLAVGLAVLAIIGLILVFKSDEKPDSTPDKPVAPAETPVQAESPVEPPEPAVTQADASPSFDVVQVAKDGRIVAAGRGTPGTRIEILRNGESIASVTADQRGEWVWSPSEPLPEGSQTLQLREQDTAKLSEPVVVLGGKGVSDGPTVVALGDDVAGKGPEVLQQPSGAGDALSLSTIQYGIGQALSMSGTGPARAAISIDLDGGSLGQLLISGDGTWQFETNELIAPGKHKVRIVLDDGRAREFDFTIDDAPQKIEVASGRRIIVVEPGNSLWRIAEATYGNGLRYTLIFNANQGQIRNPDLIYPGQVFDLPDGE